MKALFVGPSLARDPPDLSGLSVHPPARQGDIYRATLAGASAIAIIDGVFGDTPSIWHKEILHALSVGVRVIGGASLGALQAAECAPFGMLAVGDIARDYLSGRRQDDADVCLAHCPEELGFLPLSEPLVDAEGGLAGLLEMGLVSREEHELLLRHAGALYFADRSIEAMMAVLPDARRAVVAAAYRVHAISVKRRDALEVVEALRHLPDQRGPAPEWQLAPSTTWTAFTRRYSNGAAEA